MPAKLLRLHVGLPKCGSTTLQECFSATHKVHYLGKRDLDFINDDIRQFSREIAPKCDVRLLDRQRYCQEFASVLAESKHEVALISDEVLSSIGFGAYTNGNSLPQIIENFTNIVDCPIEIILVVREQMSFLRSYHKQLVEHSFEFSLSEFLALVLFRKTNWIFPMLNFAGIIRQISHQVEKVHLIPFEALFGSETASTNFFEQIGVPDVTDTFRQTHKRQQVDDFDAAQRVSINRAAAVQGLRVRLRDLSRADNIRLRKGESDDIVMLRRMLRGLMRREAQLRKPMKALLENPPPLLDDDVLALDPVLELRLLEYFKRNNRELAKDRPEFDWQALGYAM